MRTIVLPLLVGVGGASYLTGASTTSDTWEWGVTGLTASSEPYQRSVGDWRAWAVNPFGGAPLDDVWKTDWPPDGIDGFTTGTASGEQVTSLPVFHGPFMADDQHSRGRGGAVSVRSLGFLAPASIPDRAEDARLRVEFTFHTGEGFVTSYANQMARVSQSPTFEPTTAAIPAGWTVLDAAASGGLTTVTMEHRLTDPTAELALLAGGYLADLVTWQATADPSADGYRLRLTSVRMWGVYDLPPQGLRRLRQRQSLAGVDSWPLRQRQAGHLSGSWPLRQRQIGL